MYNLSYTLPAAGAYTFTIIANDSSGFRTEQLGFFTVDLNFTKVINFTPQFVVYIFLVLNRTELNVTPGTFLQLNASDKLQELPDNQTDEGLCVAENSEITLADGTEKRITEIQQGDYVLSLDESTGVFVSNKVTALLEMGTKPVYELITESGKRINTTSTHPYLVKLYSKEKCEQYENDVWNKQYDAFDGEYCTRWVEVDELEEGMEVAVQNTLNRSDVEYTTTLDWFLNAFSSDQMGEFSSKASAKYGLSFSWGDNFEASLSKCSHDDFENCSITFSNNENKYANVTSLIRENFMMRCLSESNSLNANEGVKSFTPLINNNSISFRLSDLYLKKENSTLASTTSIDGIKDRSEEH